QRLLTGAKTEGKVVWYTSLAGSSYKELAKGFETKYPGVKIEPYRGTSNDLMTKIVAEAEAKHFLADAIETTLPVLRYMRENKILVPYTSPHLGKYPAHAKEKVDRAFFIGPSIVRTTWGLVTIRMLFPRLRFPRATPIS